MLSLYLQVIKMLILVVILFMVCWGPRLVMEIYLKCCLNDFSPAAYTLRFVFYLLPFVHSCLNPLVYCFMSSKFRARLFQCCCKAYRPASRTIPMKQAPMNNRRPLGPAISCISTQLPNLNSFEAVP